MSDPRESLSRTERREVREIAESAARRVASTIRSGGESDRSGINRRDTLKLGGFGALIAGFATLGSQAAVEPAAADDHNDQTPNPNLKNLEIGQWNLSKDTVTRPLAPPHGTGGPAVRYRSTGGGPKEDKLYCLGNDYDGKPNLAIYDFKDNSWSEEDPPARPSDDEDEYYSTAGGDAAIDRPNGVLYSLNSSGFFRYLINSGSWQNDLQSPTAPAQSALAVASGSVYRFGGDGGLARIDVYDDQDDEWNTTGENLSSDRQEAVAIPYQGEIYILGGNTDGDNRAVEKYNPGTNDISTLSPLPIGTSKAGATELDGYIYVVAGLSVATQVYDIENDEWSYYPGPHETQSGFPAVGASPESNTPHAVFAFGGGGEAGSHSFRADAFGALPEKKDDDDDDDEEDDEGDDDDDDDDDNPGRGRGR